MPYDQLGEAMKARHGELVKKGLTSENAMTTAIFQRILGSQRPSIADASQTSDTSLATVAWLQSGGAPEIAKTAVGAQVEDFIQQECLLVANRGPSPPSSNYEMSFQTWIDITVTSSTLVPSMTDWRVLLDVYLGSNHFALSYSIRLVFDRLTKTRLDWPCHLGRLQYHPLVRAKFFLP